MGGLKDSGIIAYAINVANKVLSHRVFSCLSLVSHSWPSTVGNSHK